MGTTEITTEDEQDDITVDVHRQTETVEQIEKGYILTVKSKRGTGTNDRDEVTAELRTENRPSEKEKTDLLIDVTESINFLRTNQPDEEDDADDE